MQYFLHVDIELLLPGASYVVDLMGKELGFLG